MKVAIQLLPILSIPSWLWIWAGIIVIIKIVNQISSLIIIKKFCFPHTIANKLTGFLLFLTVPTINWSIIPIAIVAIIATFAAIQEGYYIGTRSENSPIFNPFLFITRYLPANIKHALRYESRGMETDVTKIHDFMTRSYSNCGKTAPKQDRCDKNLHFFVTSVIYLISRSGRVMELPLRKSNTLTINRLTF